MVDRDSGGRDHVPLVSAVEIVEFGLLLRLRKYAVGQLVVVFLSDFRLFGLFFGVFVLEDRF